MAGKLALEIKQTKPFQMVEEEAFLNIGRTWEVLQARAAEVLKEFQLTGTQYNMLRILRGAGPDGLTCSQASERMITAETDVTRLLDRLENRGLIGRERSKDDRRIVITRITNEGLALLDEAQEPLKRRLRRDLGHLGSSKLRDLIEMLEHLREPR